MPDRASEILVVLEPHGAADAVAPLRAVATVTQYLPPRLALVAGDADLTGRIAAMPGVVAVHDAGTPAPLDAPTEEERMFLAAWAARQRPKTRPGEGLSWDAPGMSPPDRPQHET